MEEEQLISEKPSDQLQRSFKGQGSQRPPNLSSRQPTPGHRRPMGGKRPRPPSQPNGGERKRQRHRHDSSWPHWIEQKDLSMWSEENIRTLIDAWRSLKRQCKAADEKKENAHARAQSLEDQLAAAHKEIMMLQREFMELEYLQQLKERREEASVMMAPTPGPIRPTTTRTSAQSTGMPPHLTAMMAMTQMMVEREHQVQGIEPDFCGV